MRSIGNPFSFEGSIGNLAYAGWTLPIFLCQHLVAWLGIRVQGASIKTGIFDEFFFMVPLRWILLSPDSPPVSYRPSAVWLTLLAFVVLLLTNWALLALSYRRAVDCNAPGWVAAAAIVPMLQILIIVLLWIAPAAAQDTGPLEQKSRELRNDARRGALQGMLIGMALTLAAVATSALIFGTYGYGIFVVMPFIIGTLVGYVANRSADLSDGETARLVFGATLLGSLALLVTALEGAACLVMAAPIGAFAALIGGVIGRQIAQSGRGGGGKMAASVAMLPIVFAIEAVFPPLARFDTMQTIEVQASPERVWKAIVQMETIEEPLSLLHHAGVAYPVRGRVFGAGVGALRYGDFSTGTAIERVTQWRENEMLAFVVLKDIAGLRELSPYRHVHAPHVHGYFTTSETSFELIPRDGGMTQIVERTSHELKLDPALYWLPFARHMVDINNARVLRHIKRQAEKSMVANVSVRPRESGDPVQSILVSRFRGNERSKN
ncbi:MAG: hypothetical protein ABW198_09995 [Pseudorhodoplanes sp.]